MFSKKIPIIYFSKDKLKVTLVAIGKTNKVLKADETGWIVESLKDTLLQAKNQLKTNKFRLLLADDLSYVVTLKIPLNIHGDQERELVSAKLKMIVPEILGNQDWDYKETGKKDQTEKEVIAFAPVQEKFLKLSQAISQAGITIEAIEPEAVAKLRHADPLIGLALKTDLKGKDDQVLNLAPKKIVTPAINKKLFIILITVLTIGGLIIGGVLTSRKALTKKPIVSPSPTSISTPSYSPEATPSAEPAIDLTQYKLLVLNGTGGKGVAAAVKDILLAEGFTKITADNADIQNFSLTEVQLKTDTAEKIFATIDRALNDTYEVTRSAELLTKTSDYDVIITVGKLKEKL